MVLKDNELVDNNINDENNKAKNSTCFPTTSEMFLLKMAR